MKTARAVRKFALELADGRAVTEDPLEEGLLDSLAREQLIAFLERKYGVAFEEEELVAENFSSVLRVAALVDSKRRSALK